MYKKNAIKKAFKLGVIGLLLISLIILGTSQTTAAPKRIIPIGYKAAKDIGYSFTTNKTITRSQLVNFKNEVRRAEKSANTLNSIRFGIASATVSKPVAVLSRYKLTVGGASGLLSSLIINKKLGSKKIQNVLNKSRAKKFKLSIKYVKKSRGQDKWYEASTISIKPI